MLNVSIDIGNSLTKCVYKNNQKVLTRMSLPNAFHLSKKTDIKRSVPELNSGITFDVPESDIIEISQIDFNYVMTDDSNEELSKVFGLTPDTDKLRVIGGDTAETQFYDELERPLLVDKVSQRVSYVSVLATLNAVSDIEGGDNNFNIIITLPLNETDENSQNLIKQRLQGKHIIETKGATKEINILKVFVIGECFASSVSYHFDVNSARKQNISPALLDGTYLVVNMGAGTSDLALFNRGKFVEKSKSTLPVAGNTVREMLIEAFNDKYRVRPTIQSAEQAIKTGIMKVGAKTIDVYDMVLDVKSAMSLQLLEGIKKYCISRSIDIRSLSCLVCTGGGALEGAFKTSDGEKVIPSNVHFLKQFIEESTEFTEVLVMAHPRWDDAVGAFIVLQTLLRANS